jgi:hypothetical protein
VCYFPYRKWSLCKYYIILTLKGWATFFSQTHPVTLSATEEDYATYFRVGHGHQLCQHVQTPSKLILI